MLDLQGYLELSIIPAQIEEEQNQQRRDIWIWLAVSDHEPNPRKGVDEKLSEG